MEKQSVGILGSCIGLFIESGINKIFVKGQGINSLSPLGIHFPFQLFNCYGSAKLAINNMKTKNMTRFQ